MPDNKLQKKSAKSRPYSAGGFLVRLINYRRKLVKQTMREVASELFVGQTRAEIAPQIVSYLHEHPGYIIGESSSYKGQDENGSIFFVRVVQFLAKKA